MEAQNDGICCGICYDSLVDPRALPCWHVACFRCILGMTQICQNRAVSCHLCRMTFLFENIRSLPRPINCNICGKYVQNPKKFPCCNNLSCSDCIRSTAINGLITCRNLCSNTVHDVRELASARLCQTCFILHTESVRQCGHSSCNRCSFTPEGLQRSCNVCEAVATPSPVPVNPQIPAGDILQAPLQRFNQPLLPGQQLNPALQLIALAQHMNALNAAQRIRLPPFDPRRYTEEDKKKEAPKVVIFYVMLAIMSYWYGSSLWTWIVCFLTILALRPRLQACYSMLTNVAYAVALYALYYYFYHALIVMGVDIVFALSRTENASTCSSISLLAVIFAFFYANIEPFFIHRFALGLVLGVILGLMQGGHEYLL